MPGGSHVNPAIPITAVLLILTAICVVFGHENTIDVAASLDAKCPAVLTTTCSTGFGAGTTLVAACSDGGTAASSMLVLVYEFVVVWSVQY